MSFWSFRTAFTGLRGDNTSPIFDEFEKNRQYFADKSDCGSMPKSVGKYDQNLTGRTDTGFLRSL
jgi:hypothetical protein